MLLLHMQVEVCSHFLVGDEFSVVSKFNKVTWDYMDSHNEISKILAVTIMIFEYVL